MYIVSGVVRILKWRRPKSKHFLKNTQQLTKIIYFYFYNNCLDLNILI